jgi:hypothetical protein
MTEHFENYADIDAHTRLMDWIEANPHGFVLNWGSMVMHKSSCAKLHGPHQTPDEGASLTRERKSCSTTKQDLLDLAPGISSCGSCKP